MKYKSIAYWPKGTFDDQGNRTEDTHDTEEQAQAVCDLLRKNGAGGDGKAFPVETYVRRDPAHSPAPWTRDVNGLIEDPDGTPVGQIFDNPDNGMEPMDEETSDFNGALIIAAPDLLAALKECRDKFGEYTRLHAQKKTKEGDAKAIANHRMFELCNAAIAKATTP